MQPVEKLVSCEYIDQLFLIKDTYMNDTKIPYLSICAESGNYYDHRKQYDNPELNQFTVSIKGASHVFHQLGAQEELFRKSIVWIKSILA